MRPPSFRGAGIRDAKRCLKRNVTLPETEHSGLFYRATAPLVNLLAGGLEVLAEPVARLYMVKPRKDRSWGKKLQLHTHGWPGQRREGARAGGGREVF